MKRQKNKIKMHYLTIIGIVVIAIGTLLTYIGQQIKSNENNTELISTVREKDKEIESLTKEVQLLRENELLKEKNRQEKIKTIAIRANRLLQEGNILYSYFFSKYGKDGLQKLLREDIKKQTLTDNEIVQKVKELFLSITMLNPSNMSNSKGQTYNEIAMYHIHMTRIYSEADNILQHYGDVDDTIVKQLDDLRGRAKTFAEILPLLNNVQGGLENVMGKGVPEQYSEFFSYYYLVQHKFEIECDKILNKK